MSTFWRQAGLNYIQYSTIAARVVREALKEPAKTEAMKRAGANVRITKWKDGKPIKGEVAA